MHIDVFTNIILGLWNVKINCPWNKDRSKTVVSRVTNVLSSVDFKIQ